MTIDWTRRLRELGVFTAAGLFLAVVGPFNATPGEPFWVSVLYWVGLITLILTVAPENKLRGMIFWMVGDLGGADGAAGPEDDKASRRYIRQGGGLRQCAHTGGPYSKIRYNSSGAVNM